jgi:dTDP-4-amino-4,6-dideoxygalactose transaminase
MRGVTVPFLRPEVPPFADIAKYYLLSEQAAYYSNGGPCVVRLADRLGEYVGGQVQCIPVANCTVGLMVAIRAVFGDPTPGRVLVATPSFTFPATAGAIEWAGFEPLFVDVEPDSWQLGEQALRDALHAYQGRFAGVMGCSTFGTPAPTELRTAWRAAAAAEGIPLLVDAAAGFGAIDDQAGIAGSSGDTEVFSFHATKPFAIGEGGLVVTTDNAVAERARLLVNFGIGGAPGEAEIVGINAKMSELHAATGLAALNRYPEVLHRRRGAAEELRAAGEALGMTSQRGCLGSTWQFVPLMTHSAAVREAVLTAAVDIGVQIRAYFSPPLHRQKAWSGRTIARPLDVTDDLATRTISVPLTSVPQERDAIISLLKLAVETAC